MSDGAQAIIELNIEHYRDRFARETDPAKREAYAKLLSAEEAKLATLRAAIRRSS
jgi:hypothetical protein